MIPAWFNRQNHPLVAATLVIPGMTLNDGGSVTFLLDTGAARTCLHPLDIFRLGIPIENFADNDSVRMDGVGGSAQYLETGAHVYFDQGLDGHGHRLLVAYAIDLLVAQPTDANRHYPSLLGRDIISRWSILYDASNRRLECNALTADHTVSY